MTHNHIALTTSTRITSTTMVQSLGISVGNSNSYVAACLAGGIEILLNEYSNRLTPSMVAFTDEVRSIGVDASSNLFMNLKNTIYDIMVLLGKSYRQLPLKGNNDRPNYSFEIEEAEDGQALVVVRHLGTQRKFTITQVLAMLFTKLKGIANNATDCVISYPQFFDDIQKTALIQAARIAGLNPLQIISDMSAVVLNYAYYRTTKEDSHKFIVFINFGQATLQSVVAWLNPKEDVVRILAAESESIGGRDFDRLLADYFVEQYNLKLTPKAYLKLVFACEKLKKVLSANAQEVPLNVESLISEDKDFSARIDRATFENITVNLLQRVEDCFNRTLAMAQANFATTMAELAEIRFNIQAVEMVGGSTRVPIIKQLIQNVFSIVPSTTLNTDEAVARGCVLHCATLHPGVKVKREVRIINLTNSESFYRPKNASCDKEARRIELELITSDRKYQARTEARNTLEEYIYAERSKLQDGDQFLTELTTCLDWLFDDEGVDASEDEYKKRLASLKKISESRMVVDTENGKATNENCKESKDINKNEREIEIEMEKGDDNSATNNK